MTTDITTKPTIRWMIRSDMPEVLGIEAAAFGEHAWNEDVFMSIMRQKNVIAMVREHKQRVVGHVVYELHRAKLDILNIAVHPLLWGNGYGGDMIGKLKGKLNETRRHFITATIWERNSDAHMFFRAQGFVCDRVLSGFFESGDDAYRFIFRQEWR